MADNKQNPFKDLGKLIKEAPPNLKSKVMNDVATAKLFMDLVKRGEELEKNTREKVKPSELVRSNNIEDRIRKMRDNLSFGAFINRSDIERLEKKIDALGSKIDHLTAQQSKSANSRVPD